MTNTSSRRRREAAAARAEERARRARRNRRVKWVSIAALAALVLVGLAGWTIRSNGPGDPAEAAAPGSPAMSREEQMLEFYQCLRDNGLDVDDPDQPGMMALPFDPDDPEVAPVLEECRSGMDGGPMQAGDGELADPEALVAFVTCMQDNGVDMPDPGADGTLNLPEDVDPSTPEFQAAIDACREHLSGGGIRVQAPGGDGSGPRMGQR